MTFSFNEAPLSGNATAEPPTLEKIYVAAGEDNELTVQSYAHALTSPLVSTVYGILYRQDIRLERVGYNLYNVKVPYAKSNTAQGEWTWSFDTTGGTVNIKVGKSHVASYPEDAPSHGGLIGVHGDDVDGVDIVIPALKISVQYSHPLGVVTIPFAKNLARYTGTCNSDTFLTCEPGEALFLGATGSDGSNAPAEVGYQFALSQNLQGQIVDSISGIDKDGWDIAWISYKSDTDDEKPVQKPQAVYIERVYERAALASVLGFGG